MAGAEANRVVFVPEVLTSFDFVKPTAAKNKKIEILLSIKSINEFILLVDECDAIQDKLEPKHRYQVHQKSCIA